MKYVGVDLHKHSITISPTLQRWMRHVWFPQVFGRRRRVFAGGRFRWLRDVVVLRWFGTAASDHKGKAK